MNWDKLLNNKRLNDGEPHNNQDRSEFQEDYDNIVFCSAFRRLQDKAQIFSLSGSDYVRTRLTHSLEVSCMGRALGTMVGKRLKRKEPSHLGEIVSAACLAHDIGNPPFGHSGEYAIREWFDQSPIAQNLELNQSEKADIANYEGNAQGFRIVTRLQGQGKGLKLTYATLAAMTKYPFSSHAGEKFGFFQSEQAVFQMIATETGLICNTEVPNRWCRHPLAYLVEAADDLCNRVIDFEDSARLGVLSYDRVYRRLRVIIKDRGEKKKLDRIKDLKQRVEETNRMILRQLAREVVDVFSENFGTISEGKFGHKELVSSLGKTSKDLKAVKEILKKEVFTDARVIGVEVPAFRVLGGLLDVLIEANEDICLRKKPKHRNKLVINFVPAQYRSKPKSSPYERLMNILDFISGMTDSYAVSLYKTLTGMSLP